MERVNKDPLYAIVNPRSGNGRTGKEWPKLKAMMERLMGEIKWVFTRGPGHATELASVALQKGYRSICSVGGDGTHMEVANAFLNREGSSFTGAVLYLLSRGTGSDLTKSLFIPRDPERAIETLSKGRIASIDSGWLRFMDKEGKEKEQAFLNVTSLGMGGEVDMRVNRTTKALGGFFSFLWATMATLLNYTPKTVQYSIDGGPWNEEKIMVIAIANGQYFGGGMWIAPMASLCDGAFDVIVVREMKTFELFTQLGRLYRGTHVSHPKVYIFRARNIRVKSTERVWLDVDGEAVGSLPMEVKLLSRSMNVIVGPEFPL